MGSHVLGNICLFHIWLLTSVHLVYEDKVNNSLPPSQRNLTNSKLPGDPSFHRPEWHTYLKVCVCVCACVVLHIRVMSAGAEVPITVADTAVEGQGLNSPT